MHSPPPASIPTPAARPLVVTGPPASGKTTVAAALAARLGRPFADVDEAVTREAGSSVAELFAVEGEVGFRARERRAFERLLVENSAGVIATGGGTLLDSQLRHRVLRMAHVLALDVPHAVLVARSRSGVGKRPLLDGDTAARLASLLETRADAYAEAHVQVNGADDLDAVIDAAFAAIVDLERSPTLVMPIGQRSYRVHVAPLSDLERRIADLAPSARLLVTDAKVERALGRQALSSLGEAGRVVLSGRPARDKTLAGVRRIWDAALAAGMDRNAVLIGVGGGGITDLTGFAAATFLRGIRYVSAPTTLLAMVDASVGGKTGFDHERGKNLIGAFHQPSVVVCDPAALSSLPTRDVRAGLAEIVKIALVRDPSLLARIHDERERLARCHLEAVAALVPGAIEAKIDVVARDEREGGERELLNFGHTIGHAIEQAAGRRLPHGECVAIGMRAALGLGERLGVTPRHVAQEAKGLLDALRVRKAAPPSLDEGTAQEALWADKKRRGGELRFVLLSGLGSAEVHRVPRAEATRALRGALSTLVLSNDATNVRCP